MVMLMDKTTREASWVFQEDAASNYLTFVGSASYGARMYFSIWVANYVDVDDPWRPVEDPWFSWILGKHPTSVFERDVGAAIA